ncbi:hypothetical protein [Pseudomonas serbica]|uniref:hypothetical protein n=1 Tax=Pseudomonas serbica TaxID=2965074 RepID=UPI00237A7523|nr:hypothetical protein [Pseudomonas serbica]
MSSSIDFAQKFLAGAVKSFDLPIEDTQAFAKLSETYSEKNASIESAVMELAHGSCHDLTIGLADALSQEAVIAIVDDAGMPVHSGLYNSAAQLILDANGVHTIEAAVAFWSGITRQPCSARLMEVDELYGISGCDESSAEIALEDFSIIADFIQENFISVGQALSSGSSSPVASIPGGSKIPVIKVASLWHWGSLDASHKFERGTSYEGNLFSMSACPEAWQRISKFGGKKLHLKADSTTLLDLYSILDPMTSTAEALKQEITEWGIAQGLLEPRTIFSLSWYDDEMDGVQSYSYKTREDAEAEMEEGDDKTLSQACIQVGTSELLARHGFRPHDIIGVEFAIIEWAKEKFPEVISGVYWRDPHDPYNGVAPCAGLFPFEVSGLTAVDGFPDDEVALKGVSKVKWVEFGKTTLDPSAPEL